MYFEEILQAKQSSHRGMFHEQHPAAFFDDHIDHLPMLGVRSQMRMDQQI